MVRRRIVALAIASLLTVAGCDAAFGDRCRDKGGDSRQQEQPTSDSGTFEGG